MRILLVYYSRTGVTEKSCKAIAEALQAADETAEVHVEELVDTKDRTGMMGYLRGGKDAMLKQATEIEPVEADVASFDLVVIGTPVWAFTCAPAPRTFCEQFAEDLERVAFIATMGGSGDTGAFEAMERYCGAEPIATLSLRERHVKSDDAEDYREPLEEFVGQLLAASPNG